MEDELDAADRVVNTLVRPQFPLEHFDVVPDLPEVVTVSRGEVVEDSNLVAARKQRAYEVGADEPGSAGYQHLHA
jgi:hypothetical protein